LGEPGIYYPTGRRNYFRTVASDEVQGAAAARWIQQLGYENVYILYGSDVYGTGVAGVFEITAKDIGLNVTGKNAFETEAELSPEITSSLAENALNSNPDVIFLAGSVGSNAEHIAVALRQADTEVPIIGPDGLAVPDLITLLGPDLSKNVYSTVVAIPPEELNTPAAIDFVQSFEAAYGTRPSPSAGAMYEAANALLYAISRAEKPTREAVLESMQNLGEYTGIFGTWRFNEQGDITPSGISGMKIQDGDWVFVNALK
jgi:branched-chain amino acid transport system substrate-binding protein